MKEIPIRTAASCADDSEPRILGVEDARRRLLEAVQPLAARERVALRDALGRVLARPVVSTLQVPAHTNSAMDGYALRFDDLDPTGRTPLEAVGTALAGRPWPGRLEAGQCIRITTGAPLPAGADTVVMQEQTLEQGGKVIVGPGQRRGGNVRLAGEDLQLGEEALAAGRRLTPADLGMLASLGIGEVTVVRRPRVSFLSTGDELKGIGEPLGEGEIYDSNRYSLHGMLSREGVELRDLGVVADTPEAVRSALLEASEGSDLVITTGGVSVGEADYIKEVLESLGRTEFWKIAMKPGRPLTFGRIGNARFFGLPGNPVAVMVTFYQFVVPVLRHLAGERDHRPLHLRARLGERIRKRPGRTEFLRGVLSFDEGGEAVVRRTGAQGSGILRSMSLANCFILLDEKQGTLDEGAMVPVQPFEGLI